MSINYGYGVILTPDLPDKAREWRNTPEIYRWCRQIEPIRSWEHEDWEFNIEHNKSIRMYGIELDKNIPSYNLEKKYLGVCGFTSIDHINQKAEFSLYIQPNMHGFGYGRMALQTLVAHGFNSLNLNRIWGETFDGNPAAKTFAEVGFQFEGTLRKSYFKEGKFIDSHIYAILREEWDLVVEKKLALVPTV